MLLRIGSLVALLGAAIPAWAVVPARPGTLNYLEGQAAIADRTLDSKSVGQTELAVGQVLQTSSGKAELLLTPGAFLRLGHNSAVRMISPGLTDTQVEVLRGEALLEVTDLKKENNLRVTEGAAQIAIEKNGLYEVDADEQRVRVFDGKAVVTQEDKKLELKKGNSTAVNAPLQSQKFDRDNAKGDLYNWSKVRSEYLSQASAQTARLYVSQPGWVGSGWYWNGGIGSWAFLSGDPFLYSPFGYGFYSPRYFYGGPRVYSRPGVYYRAPRTVVVPRGGSFHSRGMGRR
jgi:hypothetical protein